MSYFTKISTLIHTIKYLKPIQVYGRGLLYVRKLFPIKPNWYPILGLSSNSLVFESSIPFTVSKNENGFEFLNLKKDFGYTIDWNYLEFGRLWTYNLNYFEYLDQIEVKVEEGKRLIDDFITQLPSNKIGLEPYPISLRCINWIRFFIRHNIENPIYDSILFRQLELLDHNIEYHILGNHLMENGFAMLFGAYYFNDLKFYSKAKKILIPELQEQILPDGAHFELSPMYHSTMLFRMLDCYNLISNNDLFNKELKEIVSLKIEKMLGWLNLISFKNGNIPLLNDASFGVAPTVNQLNLYSKQLGFDSKHIVVLKESGYRKFETNKFELIADIGSIGPDYQPGHAHADTFNFELYVNGRPVIVDTGTSTYEVNETRFLERSTAAHNTVVVDNKNSSEVWAGHRVAGRAKVTIKEDTKDLISASHDGYMKIGITHNRSFEVLKDEIVIRDVINTSGTAYLHFFPDELFEISGNKICGKDYIIELTENDDFALFDSHYAPEFNRRIKSQSICIHFQDRLTIHIK